MRALLLLPVLLATSACGLESPTWMPSGYSYNNDEYKAQPGPEAKSLGYTYTGQQNEYINTIWNDAARTMVDELEKQGMTAQSIHVEKLPENNAFNLSFDNALREQFRSRGYTLVDAPEGVTSIRYQAYKTGDEGKRTLVPYNGDPAPRVDGHPEKPREFVLVLDILKEGAKIGEVRRTQAMPAFGYETGAGHIITGTDVATPAEKKTHGSAGNE